MIDPSFLPWWGWLLCGVVAVVIASISLWLCGFMEGGAGGCLLWIVGVVAGLGGLVALVIGLVRLAKWAWG